MLGANMGDLDPTPGRTAEVWSQRCPKGCRVNLHSGLLLCLMAITVGNTMGQV